MIWLILGLALWCGAHLFKRVAPGPRAAMQERMGDASKGVFALLLILSVVLMVIGYRQAEYVPLWTAPAWTIHLNNLLNLIAVLLFGLSGSKSRLRSKIRHPQLYGFSLWAIAHLIVNGDVASLVLWGVLLAWAVVEVILINSQQEWEPYEGGSLAGDIRWVVISLVVFVVIVVVHAWLGVWPLPS